MQSEDKNMVKEPDLTYGGLYSYADYLRWNMDEVVELIKGKVFKKSCCSKSTTSTTFTSYCL